MRVTVPEFDGPILRSQARRGNRGEEGASDVPEGTGSGSAGIAQRNAEPRVGLCGQAGVLVDQAPNLARRTTGPAPMTSSVGIGI